MLCILKRYFFWTNKATIDGVLASEIMGERIYSGKLIWINDDGKTATLKTRDDYLVVVNKKDLFSERKNIMEGVV